MFFQRCIIIIIIVIIIIIDFNLHLGKINTINRKDRLSFIDTSAF